MTGSKIISFIYEIGKAHPVMAIKEDGRLMSLDPYDLEELLGAFKMPNEFLHKRRIS